MLPLATILKSFTVLERLKKAHRFIIEQRNTGNQLDNDIIRSITKKAESKYFFQSKKFWAMVFASVLPILNSKFNLGLDVQTLSLSLGGLAAYIVGQGVADKK